MKLSTVDGTFWSPKGRLLPVDIKLSTFDGTFWSPKGRLLPVDIKLSTFDGTARFWSPEVVAGNPSFWSPAVVALSMALSTPVTTAFCNCFPIAEFAAFLKFSFVTFSAIVLPTPESITFFAIPEFTTFFS